MHYLGFITWRLWSAPTLQIKAAQNSAFKRLFYYLPASIATIIESVDYICRDSADTQYIKISLNLSNGKIVSLYDNLPFIFECFVTYNTLSTMKKHCEVLNSKVARQPKCFSSSSSDRLVVIA